jgi:hypothetical protein
VGGTQQLLHAMEQQHLGRRKLRKH